MRATESVRWIQRPRLQFHLQVEIVSFLYPGSQSRPDDKSLPVYWMIKLFAESAGYGTVEHDDMGYPPSGR